MADATFIGIHSTTDTAYIGTGMTRRASERKKYWFAWRHGDGSCEVQALDRNLTASGKGRIISAAEFQKGYTLEPDFTATMDPEKSLWKATLTPKQEEKGRGAAAPPPSASGDAVDAIQRKDMRSEGEGGDDELERSLRADFGIGLTYLKQGKRDKARQVFEDLAHRQEEFERRHKHMFNEFGIGLRKSRLYDTALMHYERARDLSPDDENLYHNMARAYYEKGDMENAREQLEISLQRNPDLLESQMFLDFLRRKQFDGGDAVPIEF